MSNPLESTTKSLESRQLICSLFKAAYPLQPIRFGWSAPELNPEFKKQSIASDFQLKSEKFIEHNKEAFKSLWLNDLAWIGSRNKSLSKLLDILFAEGKFRAARLHHVWQFPIGGYLV